MLHSLQLQSQSSFTALAPADLRTHLNVIDTSTDSYIQTLIDAAVSYCERQSGMDFRSTTWKLVLDRFPQWWMLGTWQQGYYPVYWPWAAAPVIGKPWHDFERISLLRGPLQSITSIVYYDASNTLQTLDPSTYYSNSPTYSVATVEPNTCWPYVYEYRPDGAQITFVSGFTTLPPPLLQAIKLLVGLWWVSREDLMMGPNTAGGAIGKAVDSLLDQYRTARYT